MSNIKEHVYRLHEDGLSVPQIAKKLGVSEKEAREMIVKTWREDKEEKSRSRSLLDW